MIDQSSKAKSEIQFRFSSALDSDRESNSPLMPEQCQNTARALPPESACNVWGAQQINKISSDLLQGNMGAGVNSCARCLRASTTCNVVMVLAHATKHIRCKSLQSMIKQSNILTILQSIRWTLIFTDNTLE